MENELVNPDPAPILVLVGSRSRAAQAIQRAWTTAPVVAIHRGEGTGLSVDDYRDVPDGAIPPGSIVVNCVGTPSGPHDQLQQVNHDVPLAWAEAAARAGAARMIHLSSFSVYGHAHLIDAATPEAPVTPYGRSKQLADRALLARDPSGLEVTIIRIPMLFGEGSDKMRQLVRAALRARIVPSVTPRIERSMLSYDGLANAVRALAQDSAPGVVHLADPTPFTYELLSERISQVTGRTPLRVPLPAFAAAIVRNAAPAWHARLLASSRLAANAAYPIDLSHDAALVPVLDRLILEAA